MATKTKTGLEAQKQYVSEKTKGGSFKFGLLVGAAFIRGIRDIGYKHTGSALAELRGQLHPVRRREHPHRLRHQQERRQGGSARRHRRRPRHDPRHDPLRGHVGRHASRE